MGNLSTFFVALSFLCSCQALQKVTIYNGGSNIVGKDSVTVHGNHPNLTTIETVVGDIRNSLYACYTGRWTFCDGIDYTSPSGGTCTYMVSPENEEDCASVARVSNLNSFRSIGPPDLRIKSIAVYTAQSFGGTETILQEGEDYVSGITTQTRSIATSGYSNWTLYEGTNFDGFARCLSSTQNLHEYPDLDPTLRNIGSIAPGCAPCVPQTIVMYPNHVEKLVY